MGRNDAPDVAVLILMAAYGLLAAYLVPFFALLALVTAGALLGRRRAAPATGVRPRRDPRLRFVVVIPAHDEEANVADTVASCLGMAYEPSAFRVVVVADNCTDATAGVARGAGAEVIERHEPLRRGKG